MHYPSVTILEIACTTTTDIYGMGLFRRNKPQPVEAPQPTAPTMLVRPIADLRDVEDPAWPRIQSYITDSNRDVRVLPISQQAGEEALYALQVTARSHLGSLTLDTGGLVLDHGWLRIYGGGHEDLPSITTINALPGEPGSVYPASIVFAHDILGGVFQIAGPGTDAGQVQYFAPDTLDWQSLGLGHAAFINFCLEEGSLEQFYADLRWQGWEQEATALKLDQGLSVFPPLSTMESRPIEKTHRKAVPLKELTGL